VDIKDPRGREIVRRLVTGADVFSENFRRQMPARPRLRLALSPESRLIYVSHKGFLPGPYEHRTALDEVVQMMGGLAYMTGPKAAPCARGPPSTTSWAACSAPSVCWRRWRSGKRPGAVRKCRARCSRTTFSWSPST